jgi:hypothetical protein
MVRCVSWVGSDAQRTGKDRSRMSEVTPVEHPKGTRFNWVKRSEGGDQRSDPQITQIFAD